MDRSRPGVRKPAAARKPVQLVRPEDQRGVVTHGRIVRLLVGQGHGFIRVTGNREIFFHRSDLHDGTSFNDLAVGDAVTFELLEDKISGARATRLEKRRPNNP